MTSTPSSSARFSLGSHLQDLIGKMKDTDSDLRTMALIDINKDLARSVSNPQPASSSSSTYRPQSQYFIQDEYQEQLLVEMALKLLNDSISEVKNLAVICIAGLTRRPRDRSLALIVKVLLDGISAADEEQRDISSLTLKSVILDMPLEGSTIPTLVENINMRVLAFLTKPDPNPQHASELLQILTDMYTRYASTPAITPNIKITSASALVTILTTTRPSTRKRAIPALVALVSADTAIFDTAIKKDIIKGLTGGKENAKVWVSVVANLARGQTVAKIGALIAEGKLVGMVMAQCEDPEDTEAVEGALSALEVLTLRCPTEMSSVITSIMDKALELVRYDPNYVQLDDDDVDMDDEDEDDDYEEDAYSDDEDVSWKIRRSAAKLLLAVFGTRSDLLTNFYDNAASPLISRFSEREESVRLEVLTAFEVLLKQTAAAKAAETALGTRNKRKRSEGMDEDGEDGIIGRLNALVPSLLPAILKQLSSKSVTTRQQCFALLRQIAEILGGGFGSHVDQILTAAIEALRSVDTAASSSLALAALAFLTVFFSTHSHRTFTTHLSTLVPSLSRCMRDKAQRISFQAFDAASALASASRPNGSTSPLPASYIDPVKQLFQAATDVLADASVDGDVRERALSTLGTILVHEGDTLTDSYSTCLPLITARLASETTATAAISVIGTVAESPLVAGAVFDKWLLETLPDVVVALRRSRRGSGRQAEFICLRNILNRIGSGLPTQTAEGVVVELKQFIDSPLALQVVALVLQQQPESREAVQNQLLPAILETIKTPLVNPGLLEALGAFFGAYVDGDQDCATRLVPTLVLNVGDSKVIPDATRGGTGIYTTTARCIGAVVAHSKRNAAGVLAMFHKTIKASAPPEAEVYLALLCVGEIGRFADLSGSVDLFERVLTYLHNESEEVRSAAAFAAGNLAVGASKVFLPAIIKQLDTAETEAARVLLLHALKEVILHSSSSQLERIADSLWKPLFHDDAALSKKVKARAGSKPEEDIGDDGVRNVKAACIGKLTTTAPAKFLPQLQELLHSSPKDRALVAASVRYTFIDTSSAYDELIAPIIVDFLSLMHDENVVVRRLSLASLNAAIQNKPHLIIDRLNVLQPLLYRETHIRPELRREVVMGPFRVTEDDGLENRKTAYETMYTLLGTCFNKVELPTFTERVLASLTDHDEIKALGLMILLRLGRLAPTSIVARLDDTVPSFKSIMKDVEVKEDSVKTDLERKEEMQRSALRTAVPLYKLSTASQAPAFHAFVSALLRQEQWKEFREYQG